MSQTGSTKEFIRHVVFFTAKDPNDIDQIIEGLKMLAKIPSLKHFEVCKNLGKDGISNEIDVVVYAEFEDQDAMNSYRAHPIYHECIKIVQPLRSLRFAADF